MLLKTENEGFIHGAEITKRAPSISHLLFADDSFIFTRASLTEARKIKDMLEDCFDMLGQMVNFKKPAITFSKGGCKKRCGSIAVILGVGFLTDNEKYLGNPLIIGKNKCKTFEPLINKVNSKIKSWQAPSYHKLGVL